MLTSEVLVGTGGDRRGYSWWGFATQFTGLQTPNASHPDVLQSARDCGDVPPNPPCAAATGGPIGDLYVGLGLITVPRSRHPGGVDVGMADGSVRLDQRHHSRRCLSGPRLGPRQRNGQHRFLLGCQSPSMAPRHVRDLFLRLRRGCCRLMRTAEEQYHHRLVSDSRINHLDAHLWTEID